MDDSPMSDPQGVEQTCQRCGGRNFLSWSVDSDRFNTAMEALGLTSIAIVCPSCFVEGHEKAIGMRCSWDLIPGTPFRHIIVIRNIE